MAERKKARFVGMSGGQGDDMLGLVDSMIDGKVAVEGGLKLKDLTQEIGSLFRSKSQDPVAVEGIKPKAEDLKPAPAPEMSVPAADDPVGAATQAEKDGGTNLLKKLMKVIGGIGG